MKSSCSEILYPWQFYVALPSIVIVAYVVQDIEIEDSANDHHCSNAALWNNTLDQNKHSVFKWYKGQRKLLPAEHDAY